MKIFIDGAHKVNKEFISSGWGYIITDDNFNIIKEQCGKPRRGTKESSQCELEALYQALLYVQDKHQDESFHIYTDNEPIYEGIKGLSRRTGNRAYWRGVEKILLNMVGRVDISHIKSHQKGDKPEVVLNRKVDRLANIGANSLLIAPVKVGC